MGPYVDLLRREKDFRRTYVAQLIALGGDWFALIPLLILLPELTGTGLWGAMLLATDTLVFALVGPYAGTVVDRLDRRQVIVVANTVSGLAALLLVLVRSEATAWIALLAIGIVAAGKAFAQPAGSAALPNLVDDEDLAVASVLSGASWGTMLAVGAALGGLVAGTLGTTVCFVLDAALLLTAAGLTASTTRPFTDPDAPVRERRPARHDVGEALGYARREPRVLALITCKAGPAFVNGAISLFPLYGAAAFDLGALGIGMMFSARGVGALLGPLLLRRRGTDPALLLGVLAGSMSLFGVAYLLLGATRQFWLVLVLLVLAHAGGGANWILSTYGMQRVVPDALRGRVFSADYTLATLVIAGSQVVFGLLSEVVPARELLSAAGAVVLVYAASWWSLSRRLPEPDETPLPGG